MNTNRLLKNFTFNIDGSNLEAYREKVKCIALAGNFIRAFRLNLPLGPNNGMIAVNPLETKEHTTAISTSTMAELNAGRDRTNGHASRENKANVLLITSIPDELRYLTKNKPKHPAITIATLMEYFDPETDMKITQLYDKYEGVSLRKFGYNFIKMTCELKTIFNDLSQAGEHPTERSLKHKLWKAIPEGVAWTRVKEKVEDMLPTKTFEEIVTTAHKLIVKRGLNAQKHREIDAAMTMRDMKGNQYADSGFPQSTIKRIQEKSNIRKKTNSFVITGTKVRYAMDVAKTDTCYASVGQTKLVPDVESKDTSRETVGTKKAPMDTKERITKITSSTKQKLKKMTAERTI